MKSDNRYSFVSLAVGFLSLVGMPACNDDLDITPDGRLTMEEVWKSAEYTEAFYASAANNLPMKNLWYYWFDNLPVALSSDAWSCDDVEGTGAVNAYKGRGSASDNIFEKFYMSDFDNSYWSKYWSSIRICNTFLDNAETAAFSDVRKKNMLISEAKILRAFYYLQLVKWYGDLPLVEHQPGVDGRIENYDRLPAREILRFVVSSCEEALSNPDLPWRVILNNFDDRDNRMTAGIACAIISEASLFAASALFNQGEDLWEWTYQKNKSSLEALRSHGFELYDQQTVKDNKGKFAYNSAYAEYFGERILYPSDKETIWDNTKRNHPYWYVQGLPIQTNYRAGDVPSQELVDSYDMLATGESCLDLENPYLDEQHLQPNINKASGYSESSPYKGRDLRFEATVLHNGSSVWLGKSISATVQTYDGGNCEMRNNSRTYTRTGYYANKFRNWFCIGSERTEDGSWKYYRLGAVILNFAEAAIEAGHIGEGIEAMNEIRHRAGFSQSVDLPICDQVRARLLVRKERRCEMAYEENRFFDVRRWTKNEENIEDEKYCTGMHIVKNGLRYKYERFVVGSTGSEPSKLSYMAKWHFLPIPLDEASMLEEQTGKKWQNYGW